MPCSISRAALAGSKAPADRTSNAQKEPIWASFSSRVIRDIRSSMRASTGSDASRYGGSGSMGAIGRSMSVMRSSQPVISPFDRTRRQPTDDLSLGDHVEQERRDHGEACEREDLGHVLRVLRREVQHP